MEYYQFPASLPVVEMSSIKMDMFRRDFTINTLGRPTQSGKIRSDLSIFSPAQKDIKDKILRVLHNLSFVEDPNARVPGPAIRTAIRFHHRETHIQPY
jgi:tRNA nucleotidyltransferase (CCA-adding enzyme)